MKRPCRYLSRAAELSLRSRRRLASLGLMGVLVAAIMHLLGCGTIPETRYYTLDPAEPPTMQAASAIWDTSAAGVVLRVERFAVAEPFADRRMIYRAAPREVGFWDFHLWAQPPDRMITARVAERLAETGLFKKVDSFPYALTKADLTLRGAVLAFEEVDKEDGWYGHLKIFMELVDPKTGDALWSDKMDLEKKAARKNPSAVVEALTQALDDAVDQAVSGMKAELSQGVWQESGEIDTE